MKNIIYLFITIIAFNFISLAVSEASQFQIVNAKVASLRIDLNSTYIELSPAPPACEGGHNYGAHLVLHKSRPNFDELYSALLTLYSTNEEISGIWFEKTFTGPCVSNNGNALDLYMLRTRIK